MEKIGKIMFGIGLSFALVGAVTLFVAIMFVLWGKNIEFGELFYKLGITFAIPGIICALISVVFRALFI